MTVPASANHDVAWTAPEPFWTDDTGAVQPGNALRRPQILRFTHDEFIPELLSTLQQNPAALPGFAALAETWRGTGAEPAKDPQKWLQGKPASLLGVQRKVLLRKQLAARETATPAAASSAPLKLYQPAHMRHYLVGGSLVCRVPGLPDRQIDPARHKVSFVVRRLMPRTPGPKDQPLPDPMQPALWDEYGYVSNGKAGVWQRIGAADSERDVAVIEPSEERLAMFPAHYAQDDGHPRRLYIGSVPVAKREAYQGATAQPAQVNPDGTIANEAMDPRLVLFYTQVLGPWKALVNRVMGNGLPGGDPDDIGSLRAARPEAVFLKVGSNGFDRNNPEPNSLRAMRSGLQTSSWYLLLDLYAFLSSELKIDVTQAAPTDPAALALYDALDAASMPAGLDDGKAPLVGPETGFDSSHVETNLISARRRIVPCVGTLESVSHAFALLKAGSITATTPSAADVAAGRAGWPDFLFLFADPWLGVRQPPTPTPFDPPPQDYLVEKIQARIDSLADLVKAALPAIDPATPQPEPALTAMRPADMREALYVMRLVYERPGCAPFHGTVVSAATRPFEMAGFFDPQAPARPIRIGLPLDISPAGLRKFDKNAVFMMSDMLCGQVDRMKGIGLVDLVLSVLPWPFHKDLNVPEKGDCQTGGVMCGISIPIITICALLLLMIIVSLLDLIFRWLPYFVVCFPLPGFKGRKP